MNVSNTPTLKDFGYDDQTGQSLADSLGITTDQLAAALATTPLSGGSAPQTTSYGMTTGGSPQGRDTTSTIQMLQLMKTIGAIGGDNQKKAAPQDTPGGPADSAQYQNNPLGALGAAATNSALVTNPNPASSNFDLKSGTSKVPNASIGNVPTAPTGALYNQPTGGVFNKAAMPQPTAAPPQIFPSAQPTAAQYNPGQAFAIAPQQPVMPPPAAPNAPTAQTPSTMAPQQPQQQGSGGLTSWDQLGKSAGAGYGHDSPTPAAAGGVSAAASGLANAASMWKQNQNYTAGGQGIDNLGKLGDEDLANEALGGKSGGASPAAKQAGLALIQQAQHAGDALKDYGANASWKTQPSAIPSPDDFKNGGAAVTFKR